MKLQPIAPLIVIFLVAIAAFTATAIYGFYHWRAKQGQTYKIWRIVSAIILLTAMAVGPSVPGEKAPAGLSNIDILFAIDKTTSMAAEDYDGSNPRIEGVRSDILKLLDQFQGAHVGVITFDSTASLNVPLTSDSTASRTAIKILDLELSTYSEGTDISQPLDLAVQVLEKSQKNHPERGRMFFYIGDGEQTHEKSPQSFTKIKPLINGGAVLGYGTATGGNMKSYYGFRDADSLTQEYITDNNGQRAVSKIDENNLQQIASQAGVKYLHRTSKQQSLDEVAQVSNIQKIIDTHREIKYFSSLYWVFAVLLTLLLLWWAIELLPVFASGILKDSKL
ncbi:MAG: VWA domain-containing protein [Candidatus Saccharimonas sp.]